MTKPVVAHPPRQTLPTAIRHQPLRAAGLLPLLALCVVSPLAVLSLLGMGAVAGQPHTFGVPPGVSDDGRLLAAEPARLVAAGAAADQVATTPPSGLRLRQGCRWGQPGRAPYRGSTRQALLAAGLPEDVVAQIVAQQLDGRQRGRLAISRDGIRHTGDGRVFPASGFAMGFGMTLCQNTSVNFAKGHVEMADLYEARDAQGRLHSVMVPDVCGNVSVLGARGGDGVVAGMSATLTRRADALAALADALESKAAGGPTAPVHGAGAGAAPGAAAGTNGPGNPADDMPTGEAQAAEAPDGEATPSQTAKAAGLGAGTPAGGSPTPMVMEAVGVVSQLLLPPQAAGSAVRQLGRVTAAAGRGLETLNTAVGPAPAAVASTGGGRAQPVPEPGSLGQVLLDLLALWAVHVRRQRQLSRPGPSCRPCASSSSSGRRPSSSSSSPASAQTA